MECDALFTQSMMFTILYNGGLGGKDTNGITVIYIIATTMMTDSLMAKTVYTDFIW